MHLVHSAFSIFQQRGHLVPFVFLTSIFKSSWFSLLFFSAFEVIKYSAKSNPSNKSKFLDPVVIFNSASRLLLEDGSIIVSSKHVSEWRKHQNNATFSLGISNYKNELASINNIIQAAKNKIDKKALNLIKRKLDKKILKGVVLGFDQKKKFKSQFVFFMKYFKFRIFYIRLFIRFVYKSIT